MRAAAGWEEEAREEEAREEDSEAEGWARGLLGANPGRNPDRWTPTVYILTSSQSVINEVVKGMTKVVAALRLRHLFRTWYF